MPGRDVNRSKAGDSFPDPTVYGPKQVFTANGTMDPNGGDVICNGAGALTITFPAPQVGIDDFKEVMVIAQTAQAHVLSFGANKLNGNKTSLTWTRATVGVIAKLMAINGVWHALSYQDAAAYAQYITLA